MAHGTGHIIQSLVVNLLIAVSKAVAATITGSGALLAEAIHSGADCANQGLLLLGVRSAQRPATASHPLGFGRALYFWSFMVAMLLFTGGGVVSMYEGIEKILHPHPLEYVAVGFGILLFALVLEGYATLSNVREINARRGTQSFGRYLRDTKDSDLVVVFGENAAASLGLLLALAALSAATITGDPVWDGIGGVCIGVVLIGVSIFLAREVSSLLVGESADRQLDVAVREIAGGFPQIRQVLHVITVQQGPGQVLVMLKLACAPELCYADLCGLINGFEQRLRSARPEVRWSFIEPDIAR